MREEGKSEKHNVLLSITAVHSSLPLGMVKIGLLALNSGESVKTLRYWTDLGLLEAHRGPNNYRYYDDEAATRVQFIRGAQALGFTLREIQDILDSRDRENRPCQEVRERLAEHLRTVRDRLEQLQRLEVELASRLAWAEAHPDPACEGEGCVYLVNPPTPHHDATA